MWSRYCGKLVNMCQGSMYRKDATKYRPKVAMTAMRTMPMPFGDTIWATDPNSSMIFFDWKALANR